MFNKTMKTKVIVSTLFSIIVAAAVIFFSLKSWEQKEVVKPNFIVISAKNGAYRYPLAFEKGINAVDAAVKFGLQGHRRIYVGKETRPADRNTKIYRDTILTFKD